MSEENTLEAQPSVSSKKRSVYCFLALFGLLGIHNFYIGRYVQGILQLLIGLFSFTTAGFILLLFTFVPMCTWIICNVLLVKTDGKGCQLIPSKLSSRIVVSILVPIFTAILIALSVVGHFIVAYAVGYNSANLNNGNMQDLDVFLKDLE